MVSRRQDPHPAFLAAPPQARFSGGSLANLWVRLQEQAAALAPRYAGVVLPGGARVALRLCDDGRHELVIYRREPHATPEGAALFSAEVGTFARAFGVTDWERKVGATDEGGPMAVLRETARQEDVFATPTKED
jgi:hypothetical protein